LASVNAVLGSILRLLTFPLIALSLGVFSLVITALMLMVTDGLMDSFDVDGFGPAFLGAIVIAVVTMVLDLVFLPERRRRRAERA
jgi:putative membrane protein